MVKTRVIYGLTFAAAVIFSMAYRSDLSAIILAAVFFYPFLAALFTLITLVGAKVTFPERGFYGEKNTPFELELAVFNRSIMPCVPMEILCYIPDADEGAFVKRRVFVTVAPLGNIRIGLSCCHKYRGRCSAEINKIYVVDPLRIIRLSKRVKAAEQMVFLPRRLPLREIFENSDGDSASAKKAFNQTEKEDFSHVRDYRDGDSFRLVHWKLTAKQDDIMIKEYDSINDRKGLIICDFEGCAQDRDPKMSMDCVIEALLAFTKKMLDAGICVTCDCCTISRRDILTVRTALDFERFYETMSVVPYDAEVCEFDSALAEIKEPRSALILITPRINEDVARRANSLTIYGSVILVLINTECAPLYRDFSNERFAFLNVEGLSREALNEAAKALKL